MLFFLFDFKSRAEIISKPKNPLFIDNLFFISILLFEGLCNSRFFILLLCRIRKFLEGTPSPLFHYANL
ncbi:MAG: hypothetical protein B7Z16_05225 [Algoriphagus sp. 32-45-6]|nr:MAG: hypothetical protein B7Z16_05225 [Algoriphagus sp. 32-45-6]